MRRWYASQNQGQSPNLLPSLRNAVVSRHVGKRFDATAAAIARRGETRHAPRWQAKNQIQQPTPVKSIRLTEPRIPT